MCKNKHFDMCNTCNNSVVFTAEINGGLTKFILIAVAFILVVAVFSPVNVYADTESELWNYIQQGIDNIDFTDIDTLAGESVSDKLQKIINGEFDSLADVLSVVVGSFASQIKSLIPMLLSIALVATVTSFVSGANGLSLNGIDDVIYYVGVSCIFVIVFGIIASVYESVVGLMDDISLLVDASMPILLTLVVANGGNVSAGICQPGALFLSGSIISSLDDIVMPLSLFSVFLTAGASLSNDIKIDKASHLFTDISSWLLGIVFMIYSAFMSIQGLTSSAIDGISVRTIKFAAKNYIPLIGGYVSDGFDLIVASTSLIKNAFGVVVLGIMFVKVLSPIVYALSVNFGLQFVMAVCEPIIDKRYISFVNGVGKTLVFWVVAIVAVSFMFLILVLIAICSAGVME